MSSESYPACLDQDMRIRFLHSCSGSSYRLVCEVIQHDNVSTGTTSLQGFSDALALNLANRIYLTKRILISALIVCRLGIVCEYVTEVYINSNKILMTNDSSSLTN